MLLPQVTTRGLPRCRAPAWRKNFASIHSDAALDREGVHRVGYAGPTSLRTCCLTVLVACTLSQAARHVGIFYVPCVVLGPLHAYCATHASGGWRSCTRHTSHNSAFIWAVLFFFFARYMALHSIHSEPRHARVGACEAHVGSGDGTPLCCRLRVMGHLWRRWP